MSLRCTGPGRGRLRSPRRQPQLRSFLPSRSFPRRPPAYVLTAPGATLTPTWIRRDTDSSRRPPVRNLGGTPRAKPHHAAPRRQSQRGTRGAARSFPRRPPAYVLTAPGATLTPTWIRRDTDSSRRPPVRNLGGTP